MTHQQKYKNGSDLVVGIMPVERPTGGQKTCVVTPISTIYARDKAYAAAREQAAAERELARTLKIDFNAQKSLLHFLLNDIAGYQTLAVTRINGVYTRPVPELPVSLAGGDPFLYSWNQLVLAQDGVGPATNPDDIVTLVKNADDATAPCLGLFLHNATTIAKNLNPDCRTFAISVSRKATNGEPVEQRMIKTQYDQDGQLWIGASNRETNRPILFRIGGAPSL